MSKWINENGIFYPVGDFRTYASPGSGVFNLVKSPNPMDTRLGLVKVGEKFEFPFKLYDLGIDKFMKKVKNTWNSEYYEKKNQNLGIILNGVKGTGKSLSAKVLCNELELPVIVINNYLDGIIHFISTLEFECVILIDEAEKTFNEQIPDASQTLLKIIDGVTNKCRKLYILTTNYLKLNENLLGRPGRIRYIKEFENISKECIFEYLNDNLLDKTKTNEVLEIVGSLEVSTIDTLKSIIDEFNIHGSIEDVRDFNLTFKTNYGNGIGFLVSKIDLDNKITYDNLVNQIKTISNLIKKYKGLYPIHIWLYEIVPEEMIKELDLITVKPISLNRIRRKTDLLSQFDDDEIEFEEPISTSIDKKDETVIDSLTSVFNELETYSINWVGNDIRVGSHINGLGEVSKDLGNNWYVVDNYYSEYWVYIDSINKSKPY